MFLLLILIGDVYWTVSFYEGYLVYTMFQYFFLFWTYYVAATTFKISCFSEAG